VDGGGSGLRFPESGIRNQKPGVPLHPEWYQLHPWVPFGYLLLAFKVVPFKREGGKWPPHLTLRVHPCMYACARQGKTAPDP